jgi:ABC-type molybdate transport system substrate-binding protein
VYRTDAKGDAKVSVAYDVPIVEAPPIVYPGVVLTRAPHPESARQFIAFLQSAASREAISAAGFIAPDSAAAR